MNAIQLALLKAGLLNKEQVEALKDKDGKQESTDKPSDQDSTGDPTKNESGVLQQDTK
jgi:hypothetical protein